MSSVLLLEPSVSASDTEFLLQNYTRLRQALARRPADPLPPAADVAAATAALPILPSSSSLSGFKHDHNHDHDHEDARQDETGHAATDDGTQQPWQTIAATSDLLPPALGPAATLSHILSDLVPGLSGQALSARYFGFVTGGAHPAAEAADNVVSALDNSAQVHLPTQSASTAVEDAALRMLLALLDLDPEPGSDGAWPGRTFTTGATASNVLGLACAREALLRWRLPPDDTSGSPAQMGLLRACAAAGVVEVQVLTSMGHSSLYKAASIVGLGHAAVKELRYSEDEPWRLDVDAVERELMRERDGVVSIVSVSAGEVNTGRFATNALDMPKLRSLADKYQAWIHVDGAFGMFARALPRTDEFLNLHAITAGLELADSIALDGHKLLNVPYDAGVFFCRDAVVQTGVFANPNAAYLSGGGGQAAVISPLNLGIENSRRFRALPVYAVLRSEGRQGMAAMFARMVLLARGIAAFVRDSEHYEWLPDRHADVQSVHIIVLFRARDRQLNEALGQRINETRKIYVSGTAWRGEPAVRIAVSSWKVDVDRDLAVVKEVLASVAKR